MNEEEKVLVKEISLFFANKREQILDNWIGIVRENGLIECNMEYIHVKDSFEKLTDGFIDYLSKGNFQGYYNQNELIARDIANNDISYAMFIKLFHLFEKSYLKLLFDNFTSEDVVRYIIAIDELHHNTITIISDVFFHIKNITVFSLAKLAELRDGETGFHLERTRDYSVLLAKELRMNENFMNQLYEVGPLHDIGKVGIKDSILLKPDKLTQEEFEEVKKHTIIGSEAIMDIIKNHHINKGYLTMANEIILYHHEKYDGTGYPFGLAGEEIPIVARIFSLADAYDAIVSKRPYKGPLPHEEAVKRIKYDSGRHFDPEVVNAFLRINMDFKKVSDEYNEFLL